MTEIISLFFVAVWLVLGTTIAVYGGRGVLARRIAVPGYDITRGIVRLVYTGAAAVLLGLGIGVLGLGLALSTLGALLPGSPLAQTFGLLFCGSLPLLALIALIVRRHFTPANSDEF